MRQLVKLIEIERKDMPQVKGKDLPVVLDTLTKNGIAYRSGKVVVDMLKPTQENGIPEKIDRIALTITKGESPSPIVISKDGSILDGHHRWLACKKVNGNGFRMNVVMIMLPKWKALEMFRDASDEV